MSNYLNINIPTFLAGLDEGFLYDGDPSPTNKQVPVEVFAYTSIPQRRPPVTSRLSRGLTRTRHNGFVLGAGRAG